MPETEKRLETRHRGQSCEDGDDSRAVRDGGMMDWRIFGAQRPDNQRFHAREKMSPFVETLELISRCCSLSFN